MKDTFDYKIYNDLWEVEDANEQINRNNYKDKAEFLKKSAQLFAKYNLTDKLGIGLLHKHNNVEAGERMVEFEGTANNEKALITKPVESDFGGKSVPTVWTIIDGNFHPLEFTTDPLACHIFNNLEMPAGFLDEYRDQVNSSPIGKYLGLAVVERDFYNTDSAEDFPLEYSDAKNRANVIFLRDRSETNKAIETAWNFRRVVDVKLGCDNQSYCTTACGRGCQSVDGGHDKIHTFHHHVAYEHK